MATDSPESPPATRMLPLLSTLKQSEVGRPTPQEIRRSAAMDPEFQRPSLMALSRSDSWVRRVPDTHAPDGRS